MLSEFKKKLIKNAHAKIGSAFLKSPMDVGQNVHMAFFKFGISCQTGIYKTSLNNQLL